MTNKFQNKYRIPSSRLKNWDYGNNGAYFITICTRNRDHFFGEIVSVAKENKMELNEIGRLAYQFWAEIPKHFPSVELGNYVVMPNHVHGILIIDKKNVVDDLVAETLQCNVSAHNGTTNEQMSKISPKSGTISTIIRSYKSAVTKNGHFIHADFEWQSRFHDHIIRNSESFERIQNYIETNPKNWKEDKFCN
ncbi:transposase [Flavobacterium psychrotolerans]|uniref:Transposase n=1 Tax=Flavobacterium psychrotolerans TaxID=2169410 RepID=A0A2U1JN36_9FLAO|nr:transposase [Flavobacterium psychrotolerans]PWA06570.1 transposase [Flavobacterium psychrotolerans]